LGGDGWGKRKERGRSIIIFGLVENRSREGGENEILASHKGEKKKNNLEKGKRKGKGYNAYRVEERVSSTRNITKREN